MRTLLVLVFGITIFTFSSPSYAQITNFVVNGSSTNFTMASGDTLTWSYNIPTGGTAVAEIWYDVNGNGTIEPSIDRQNFAFTQTDGDNSGNGGPPDLDGAVNGHVFFSFQIGLAPGAYIMKFSNNGSSAYVTATVTPLASPAHSISGHVTVPAGKSPQYLLMNMESSGNGLKAFWEAATDASGNYTINMNADTSGNPWRIHLAQNPYPPSIVAPQETTVVITGNHTGYDFTLYAAAAQVAGTILDENGVPIVNRGAYIMRTDTTFFSRRASPDVNGFFQIGLLAGDLGAPNWTLQSETNGNNYYTTTEMQAFVNLGTINPGDSIYKVLHVYTTNSTIRGTIRIDGAAPNFPLQVMATSPDTAVAYANSDSLTGNFTIPVSNKLHSYNMTLNWMSFGWIIDPLTAHPGDSLLTINVHSATPMDVMHRPGWNMLALPVVMPNTRKVDLFPSATTAAFFYVAGSGYKTDTLLQYGKGYWMKFVDSSSNVMFGSTFARETLNVLAGWNMIAPPTYGLPTSNIVPVGTTTTTPYYGYSGSYYTTSSLNGGTGYWIKVSSPGQLIVNSSSIAPSLQSHRPPALAPGPDEADEVQQLTFTDAGGETRALYFSTGAPKRDLSWYELPPVPPAGVMDVRYASQQRIEFGAGRSAARIPIAISSALYPVQISLSGAASPVRVEIDGKEYLLGGGTLPVAREQSSVALILGGSPQQARPASFALRQNYPNPFNPSTLISYDIASPARVRLVIYNTLGEVVASPVDEFKESGSYEYVFSSADLPSGVYFYRLTAGNFTAVNKMILMK